jgi:hypothetical protein
MCCIMQNASLFKISQRLNFAAKKKQYIVFLNNSNGLLLGAN